MLPLSAAGVATMLAINAAAAPIQAADRRAVADPSRREGPLDLLARQSEVAGADLEPTIIGGTYFFTANDGVHGAELWKSDGTTTGTTLVRDIVPGGGGKSPRDLLAVGATLFFTANDRVHGQELWKSDGTEAGTLRVADINPGGADAFSRDRSVPMTAVGGTVYFRADDGIHGEELWRSDGTQAGTSLVADVRPGPAGSAIQELAAAGPKIFFDADDGVHGEELWATDGTANTSLVKDVTADEYGNIRYLVPVGGKVFFFAPDGPSDIEYKTNLWSSDGTSGGTTLVASLHDQYTYTPFYYSSSKGTVVGGTLYFEYGSEFVEELWKSDGSAVGTQRIKRFSDDYSGSIQELTTVGGTVFFTHDALWKTDGSSTGTGIVVGNQTDHLTVSGGGLYFTRRGDGHGRELWKTNGERSGTSLVKDVLPGAKGSVPDSIAVSGGTTFFFANDGTHGREIWQSNGTADGTRLVMDIAPGPRSSRPLG